MSDLPMIRRQSGGGLDQSWLAEQDGLYGNGPSGYGPTPNNASTPGPLRHALRRWWKQATVVGVLLAAVFGTLVLQSYEPRYEARAWMRIVTEPRYVAFVDNAVRTDLFLRTQIEMLRSPTVMEVVAARPEIAARGLSAGYLSYALVSEQKGESELFVISFTSKDPETSALVVNAVVDVYHANQSSESRARSQRIIELLRTDKTRRLAEIELLRSQSRKLIQEYPELAKTVPDNPAANPLAALQTRSINAEVEQDVLRAQLEAQREAAQANRLEVTEEMIDQALATNPQILRMAQLVSDKEVLVAQTRAVSVQGADEPLVKQMEREIAQYRTKLIELRETLRPEVVAALQHTAAAERDKAIAATELEITKLVALDKRLQDQLAQRRGIGAKGANAHPKMGEFHFVQSELARAEAVLEQIEKRADALRTEIGAPTCIEIVHRATVPSAPSSTLSYGKVTVASLIGFFIPFGIAVLLTKRSLRIVEPEQIHQQIDLTVVGEIARLPDGRLGTGGGSRRLCRQRSTFEESVNSFVTRLLLSRELHDAKVIVTASAVSGEGKTHLASHVALSLSRASSEPTLIIDADLRDPEIHEMFDIANDQGLSEVLDQSCDVQAAIVRTWSKTLHILPAGRLTKNVYGLFRGEPFANLLRELRQHYRYIVIDVPPVLAASESLIIAKAADATLLCTMWDVSRGPQIKTAFEQLVAAGARPHGAVLLGVPPHRYENAYGTYPYGDYFKTGSPRDNATDDRLLASASEDEYNDE